MTIVSQQYLEEEVLYMSPEGAKMIIDGGINKAEKMIMTSTLDLIDHANPQFLSGLSQGQRQLFVNSIILAQTHLRRNWSASNLSSSARSYLVSKRLFVGKLMGYPLCISRNSAEIIAYSNAVTFADLQCPNARVLKCMAIEVFDRVMAGDCLMGPGQAERVYCAILQIMSYRQGQDPHYPPEGIPCRTPPS